MSERKKLALCALGFGFGLTGLSQAAHHLGYAGSYIAGFGHGFGSALMLLVYPIIILGGSPSSETREE